MFARVRWNVGRSLFPNVTRGHTQEDEARDLYSLLTDNEIERVGFLKRGRLASQWDRRAVEAHEQIKLAFDPKGLLNPEKKLAR